MGVGDVNDIHHYPEPRAPEAEENRAIVLGEFGGLGLMVKDHMWQAENWGYEKMESAEALLIKYENFYREVFRLVKDPGLSAVVYTQTTDVETETNGLMTYDRFEVKMGIENIARAHAGYFAPGLKSELTQFIDSYEVDLTSPAGEPEIFYSLEGLDPDKNSSKFTAPFKISKSTRLKSVAVFPDGTKSRISEFRLEKVEPKKASEAKINPGLEYSFFEGAWEMLPDFSLEKPVRKGISPKIDLEPSRGREFDFGMKFSGFLNVPVTGVYLIYLSSDDGGRLIIDGEQIIDYDGIHGMGEKKAAIALETGLHPIEFTYFQHLGGRGLKLSWESGQIPKEEISAKFFGH